MDTCFFRTHSFDPSPNNNRPSNMSRVRLVSPLFNTALCSYIRDASTFIFRKLGAFLYICIHLGSLLNKRPSYWVL